jgi:peptidyl-prolyl cis-trans isomerase B (cyclophilin B)
MCRGVPFGGGCAPYFFVTSRRAWDIFRPMKNLILTLVSCLSLVGAHAQEKTEKKEETKPASAAKELAVIETSAGTMVAEFWPEVAPKTVENFKKLAREGFYDGTAFHRIVKGFMIQGGDPNTKDPAKESSYGTGGPGYTVKAEFNERKHERGVLSMARSAHPDSAGSQFFVMLDRSTHLDNKYTGFGKLIKGEDVLMKIGETPVGPSRGGEVSKPLQRVEVKSIKIVPADSVK